jgi:site-specific recombinase XerC
MNRPTSSTTGKEHNFPNPGTTIRKARVLVREIGTALRRPEKRRRCVPQSIKPEDLRSLLHAITNPREGALLLILIESGLRVGEISRLDRSTIRQGTSTLADGSEVRLGTGEVLLSPQRRYRSFWIESDVVNAVADYLTKDRAEDDEPALLVTKQGKRINTSATSTVVAKWCKSAGIEPLGCHRFRQNLGVNLAVAGTSGLVMMQLLGYPPDRQQAACREIEPARIMGARSSSTTAN